MIWKLFLALSLASAVLCALVLVHGAGLWTLIPAGVLLVDGAWWAWLVCAWLVGSSMTGGRVR